MAKQVKNVRTVGLLTFATISGTKLRKFADQYATQFIGDKSRVAFANTDFSKFIADAKRSGLLAE